jgi:hypothetical protein
MSLKWVTKNSGQMHYCYDADSEKIVGRVYESFSSSICSAYVKDEEQKDLLIGEYIKLSSAKIAVEEKHNTRLNRALLNG